MRSALLVFLVFTGCRCSSNTFEPDEAARVCVTLQTCSPIEFAQTYGNSLEGCTTTPSPVLPWPGTIQGTPTFTTGLEQPYHDVFRCLLVAHGDCAKAATCWASDGDAGACTNFGGVPNASCTGDTISGCTFDRQRIAIDCGRYLSSCTRSLFSTVGFAACAPAKCPEVPACRGNVAEYCFTGGLLLWDCSRSGRRCEAPGDGGPATCVLGDKTCDPRQGSRCEGTVAIGCEGLGFETRVDCAANPTQRRCSEGRCVDTGTECAALPPNCDGSKLAFCQDGFLRSFDCEGAGFGGCDAGVCLQKSRL